ncbi:hypothetical protein ABPG75_001994 [Micractinium tetrahymenae]
MTGFPRGLQVLLVDEAGACGASALALQSPELDYCVSTVTSVAAAQQCFAGGAVAYDAVVCEYALLSPATAPAFFRSAAALHAPVVLMGEAPSPEAVLQGVRWGAADFLEKPLSMLKLRNLWTHKIRKMMERGNGGVLPRRPSCPQLPSAGAPSPSPSEPAKQVVMPRTSSLPGLSCPATPLLRTSPAAAPQASSSLASGDSACQQPGGGAVLPAAAGDCSDATTGQPRRAAAEPGAAAPGAGALLQPAGPAAPLACMRLGAPGEALPAAVVLWPALPVGITWGTPVGCGVPPPPLPGTAGPAAAAPAAPPAQPTFPQPSIKWCPPGSLPVPATTYDLLLPDNFSLARAAAEACDNAGSAGTRGPLGLRLTVTPDLLADFNATLHGQHAPLRPPLMPASAPGPTTAPTPAPF